MKRLIAFVSGERTNERGQVLIFFVAIISVMFIAAAMAIDYGFWLSERRGIARASDMAALAASGDLPANPPVLAALPFTTDAPCATAQNGNGDVCIAAFEWAERNGYGPSSGAEVEVTMFCGNNLPRSVTTSINGHNNPGKGVCVNDACDASGLVCAFPYLSPCPNANVLTRTGNALESGCDAVNVTVKKPALNMFSAFFGGVNFDVGFSSWGSVTFRLIPTDSAVAIDASGSMNSAACGGCPSKIARAKASATDFVDYLTNGSSITKVGYAPYMGCYSQPHPPSANCVAAPINNDVSVAIPNCDDTVNPNGVAIAVACLNTDGNYIKQRIASTTAVGFTNICLGLRELQKILDGAGNQKASPDTKRFAVVLTDGDNFYNAADAPGLDPLCAPSPATTTGGSACNTPRSPANRSLDLKTSQLATTMKASAPGAAAIEIFTIGVGVCNPNNTTYTPTQCDNQVGQNNDPPSIASQRLLKCVASSTRFTNDHYFYAPDDGSTLGDIFQTIAIEIASRGLSAGSAAPP